MLFHPRPEQLDMRTRRGHHLDLMVGGPLEEPAQILAIRLQCSAAVAGKERRRSKLRLVEPVTRWRSYSAMIDGSTSMMVMAEPPFEWSSITRTPVNCCSGQCGSEVRGQPLGFQRVR